MCVCVNEGMDAHPFFDYVEADEVDLILITHFHIDHCAALPYFTEKTNFKVFLLLYFCSDKEVMLLSSIYFLPTTL